MGGASTAQRVSLLKRDLPGLFSRRCKITNFMMDREAMSKPFLVTGGAGFIGSAVVRELIWNSDHRVVNLDKLTYAGNLESLASVSDHPRYSFLQVDICDAPRVQEALRQHQPDVILHLAAESHVDRSIDGPAAFIQTNLVGTAVLLEAARAYWNGLRDSDPAKRSEEHTSELQSRENLVCRL